jgi:hydrogenase expression/formation protein HypE
MTTNKIDFTGLTCPIPLKHDEKVMLGHGSGGLMSQQMIRDIFVNAFHNPVLNKGNDAGFINNLNKPISVSTDAHVVYPLFFPGGDIGKLAICGTVNDVSMLGAKPLFITASFILEEGFPFSELYKIVWSMKQAADEAEITVIAGDTKVVEKGKADGVYISTAGIGTIEAVNQISGDQAKSGDKVIISGFLGDHGIAVLNARGDLGFSSNIESDIAPLNHMVSEILKTSINIHVLRDPTRGGLATTLNEIAKQSGVCIKLIEESIPVRPETNSVCEMLGFDPLYIANEGKLIVIVSPDDAEDVLETIKKNKYGNDAKIIGEVVEDPAGRVLMRTILGSHRVVDTLRGELLPRIC